MSDYLHDKFRQTRTYRFWYWFYLRYYDCLVLWSRLKRKLQAFKNG